MQAPRVGAADLEILADQPPVEGQRRREPAHGRVEGLGEPAPPHRCPGLLAHFAASFAARPTWLEVRAPRPKISMKPGAEECLNWSPSP